MQSNVRAKDAGQGTNSAHNKGRTGTKSKQHGSRAHAFNHMLCQL